MGAVAWWFGAAPSASHCRYRLIFRFKKMPKEIKIQTRSATNDSKLFIKKIRVLVNFCYWCVLSKACKSLDVCSRYGWMEFLLFRLYLLG